VTVFNGIRIRMGIHTGTPAARRNPVTGRFDYFGQAVNLSARVSDAGHGGQVVATQEVVDALGLGVGSDPPSTDGAQLPLDPRLHEPALRPVVSDMGCHALKGIKEPVRIFQIMPAKLRLRTLPPLRTPTNEKLAAATAAATVTAIGPATTAEAAATTPAPAPSS
jgi:class 3 adenylate cyclase